MIFVVAAHVLVKVATDYNSNSHSHCGSPFSLLIGCTANEGIEQNRTAIATTIVNRDHAVFSLIALAVVVIALAVVIFVC